MADALSNSKCTWVQLAFSALATVLFRIRRIESEHIAFRHQCSASLRPQPLFLLAPPVPMNLPLHFLGVSTRTVGQPVDLARSRTWLWHWHHFMPSSFCCSRSTDFSETCSVRTKRHHMPLTCRDMQRGLLAHDRTVQKQSSMRANMRNTFSSCLVRSVSDKTYSANRPPHWKGLERRS